MRFLEQQYTPTFGAWLLVHNIAHSAFVVAGLSPAGFSGVLPFGLTATGGEGAGTRCSKSGSNPVGSTVCSGPFGPGNFGFLSFSVHGPERTRDCSPSQDSVTMDNVAMGVDHDVSLLAGVPWFGAPTPDNDTCPDRPNGADGDSGNVPGKLGTAMYSGAATSRADGLGPRLSRGTFGSHTTIEGHAQRRRQPLVAVHPGRSHGDYQRHP